MRVDEVSNCIGGHPGVVPQRPTKRLADEEFGIGCPLLNVRKQPGFVDCILVSKLVKDGGSSDSDVVVIDPSVHDGTEFWIPHHQRADRMCRKRIDGIPP